MIAYKKEALENLYARQLLADAFYQKCMTRSEYDTAVEKFPVAFYTPNILIRTGLFLLTFIISIFTFGLFALFFSATSGSFTVLCFLFALFAYGALEFFVSRLHFGSGVDDALIWITLVFVVTAFNISSGLSYTGNALLIFIATTYLSLRFANMLISALACIAFLAFIFFSFIKLGEFARAVVPFVMMISAMLIYFIMSSNRSGRRYRHYAGCMLLVSIIALVGIYIAGNYFVVREAGNSLMHLGLIENTPLPFGLLFWIFTILIPFIYLGAGIVKKDLILIRVGLLLIGAAVLTFRNYYHVLPVETAFIIAGILFVAAGYGLIKYLVMPKHGFTDEQSDDEAPAIAQIESLALAQTFTGQYTIDNPDTSFGGGSGGGGGAGGEF